MEAPLYSGPVQAQAMATMVACLLVVLEVYLSYLAQGHRGLVVVRMVQMVALGRSTQAQLMALAVEQVALLVELAFMLS